MAEVMEIVSFGLNAKKAVCVQALKMLNKLIVNN